MADIYDVEMALVDAVALLLYPDGPSQPSAVAAPAKVYRGWPIAAELDKDLKRGAVNVSVFNAEGVERDMTIYGRDEEVMVAPTSTLAWTVSGDTATLSGVLSSGQAIGYSLRGVVYAVIADSGDTLATLVGRLAAQIQGAVASADSFLLQHLADGRLAVSTIGVTAEEVGRTEREFIVTVWAPSDPLRVAVAKAIGTPLRAATFLRLADGTAGKIRYSRSMNVDLEQKDGIYRRDFRYWVEYPDVVLQTVPGVGIVNFQNQTPGS
jgi:hypothetical protein